MGDFSGFVVDSDQACHWQNYQVDSGERKLMTCPVDLWTLRGQSNPYLICGSFPMRIREELP
jgi:hypothetical protein